MHEKSRYDSILKTTSSVICGGPDNPVDGTKRRLLYSSFKRMSTSRTGQNVISSYIISFFTFISTARIPSGITVTRAPTYMSLFFRTLSFGEGVVIFSALPPSPSSLTSLAHATVGERACPCLLRIAVAQIIISVGNHSRC